MHKFRRIVLAIGTSILPVTALAADSGRHTVRLDGAWRIAEGGMAHSPGAFRGRAPVPGLVDMAVPRFDAVGEKAGAKLRQAFWYRRSFKLDGAVAPVARLKIHKAMYGTRVYLNGRFIGEHLPCFTPGYFDLQKHLKGNGQENTLTVRVGALPEVLPGSVPSGWDFEKVRYIPGIYDSVELLLSGTPFVERLQAVPDIAANKVRVAALVRNAGAAIEVPVSFTLREARYGKTVNHIREALKLRLGRGETRTVDFTISVPDCRLWSPEDPFLYELTMDLGTDALQARFGMRSFRLDPASGRAILNGRPYALRGTNVCIYRFFEDPPRGDKPWREEWVRRLHQVFKSMHWNSARYCIGFPPESWYNIADEEGILIQDEFPIWYLGKENWPRALTSKELIAEYTEWMQERWNHPSVVIWDAQNESETDETGKAIQAVRGLDLSGRPWDNGWSRPQAPGDVYEAHPYAFYSSKEKREPTRRRLADFAVLPGAPGIDEKFSGNVFLNAAKNPVIINEYGWMWLNRHGTPTTLTESNYRAMLGEDASAGQRFELYARILAAKTEFWRARRQIAGILHFCGLAYSREGGETSDHFMDVERLILEPNFVKYARDAFAPVGIMVDEWAEQLPAGKPHAFKIVVTNDLDAAWSGAVSLSLLRAGEIFALQSRQCRVEPYGQAKMQFELTMPLEAGKCQVVGELSGTGPVRSYRDFEVK